MNNLITHASVQLEVEESEGKGHTIAEHSHALTGCFSQLQLSAGCVKHDSVVPHAYI